MIEVSANLFVGDEDDEAAVRDQPGWFIVSAARDPYHRQALGYSGRGAPKDHFEYLMAERPGRLILNLVDVDDPAYIREEIVEKAVDTIDHEISAGHKVLVHCNKGGSRGPTIALMFLHQQTSELPDDFDEAVQKFTELYPAYAPARGMAEYAKAHW